MKIRRSILLSFIFIVFSFLFLSNISFALTEDELKCSSSTTTVISACGDGSTCTSGKCADGTSCVGICPIGSTCSFLPKCKAGCNTGCQIGYYLSDGDGDHTNNCIEDNASGRCTKSNIKGICEICPPGFYCKGGMKDKIPCPSGTYTDKPGSTVSTDCKVPDKGYCVAKAKLVGTGTITIPSVCIEKPDTIISPLTGDWSRDVPGGINSGMANDEGIKGYTLNNKLGANISIPCPVGTYSTAGGVCKVPDKGYCASSDGINCICSDTNGGGKPKPSGSDINTAIISSGCITGTSTLLGASKQVLCPLGTYDLRTAIGGDYTKPSPFCVYPDVGQKTGSTIGSFNQVDCEEGKYDSRWDNINQPNYSSVDGIFHPYSTANQAQAECIPCPIGTYQEEPGKAYCIYPEVGQYQDSIGQSTTKDCPVGTYDSRTTYFNPAFVVITPSAIGTSSPMNYSSGKIHVNCTSCPAGTYQDLTGQAKCKYPDKLFCSSKDGISCSEQELGVTTQVECKDEQYDPRQGNLNAPNPNCTGCTDANYTSWLLQSCSANNTWNAVRTPLTIDDWSKCNDIARANFGSCGYCSAANGGHCSPYDCNPHGGCYFGPVATCTWYDTCYHTCFSNNCSDTTKKCAAGYSIDGYTCNTCPGSGVHTWTNPGVTCAFTCSAGFYKSGNSCVDCGVLSANSIWTNPGVTCDFTCSVGFYKSGNSCVSCGVLPANYVWVNSGVDCNKCLKPTTTTWYSIVYNADCSWTCGAAYIGTIAKVGGQCCNTFMSSTTCY